MNEKQAKKIWGCLKSPNPLTAEVAKILRKVRKELNLNHLALACSAPT